MKAAARCAKQDQKRRPCDVIFLSDGDSGAYQKGDRSASSAKIEALNGPKSIKKPMYIYIGRLHKR